MDRSWPLFRVVTLLLDTPKGDGGPLALGRDRRRVDPGDLPRRLPVRHFPTAGTALVGSRPGG